MKKFLKTLYQSALYPINDGTSEWFQAREEESRLETEMCSLIGEDERLHAAFFKYMRSSRALIELTGRDQFARGMKCGVNLILSVKKE